MHLAARLLDGMMPGHLPSGGGTLPAEDMAMIAYNNSMHLMAGY